MSNDEERIEKLQKDFQFTLSKISHEIRNPVALINSFLQLMAEKYPQVQEFDYWDDIQDNMEDLITLLNELSIYNNATILRKEPVEIASFVESTIHSLQPTLDYLQIQVSCDTNHIQKTLMLDSLKIKEVIYNIVRNAWEAMESDGEIHVELHEEKNNLELHIKDNGSGISEEYQKDLFEPFVTHKKEGNGLGLAIACQVMHAHGGEITFSSTVGEGSTFTLSFPIA